MDIVSLPAFDIRFGSRTKISHLNPVGYSPVPSVGIPYYYPHPINLHAAVPHQQPPILSKVDFSKLSVREQQEVHQFLQATSRLEAEFSRGLFWGAVPLPKCIAHLRESRARFQWPSDFDEDDRLLIYIRCIRQLGFETVGGAERALVARGHFKHETVAKAMAYFLRSDNIDTREQPVGLVDAIFNHPKARMYKEHVIPLSEGHLHLPIYIDPPNQSQPSTTVNMSDAQTTQHKLSDWALQRTIERVDKEMDKLASFDYFIRSPKAHVSWDLITRFDLGTARQHILETAPALYSLLTTAALSDNAKKHCIAPIPSSSPSATPLPSDEDQEDIHAFVNSTSASAGTPDSEETSPLNNSSSPEAAKSHSMRRDPWLGVTVVILILLQLRYRWAIIFPTLIGVFLFTCNVNRDVYALLGRIGLSISYSATQTVLETLAEESSERLISFGSILKNAEPNFQLLLDNVNKMKRAWQLKLGQSDELKSGTAATLVRLEDVPPGVLNFQHLADHMQKPENKRSTITMKTLQADIDWRHVENIGAATALRVWAKHIPSLRKFSPQVENLFREKYSKRRLRLRKSEVHTMRTSDIDESKVGGVSDVIINLIKQLAIKSVVR
ncbi:hypothetical protein VNI00_010650 [Paramarasmius palmivorus]|uniref:DUF6589 domain-containing protein n=1 Tax=Paramarasmius palmivorus TaxID=297713 RepID=A0AAW0BCK3_9AGAR